MLALAKDVVEVNGKRLKFTKAVIATGARAAVPDVPGLQHVGFITNNTVFNMTQLPARLAVIGAGPVGCELAQAFARFGSRVAMFQRGSQLLPREDRDAADIIKAAMIKGT